MLRKDIKILYNKYGQRKQMGIPSPSPQLPHYFLIRTFLGENDLLIIFNTKRCSYKCSFCSLPAKSSKRFISTTNIIKQFRFVINECKHALSILDRISISNEGSILDRTTFPERALCSIAEAVHQLRRVRTLVLETRLEFFRTEIIERITKRAPRVKVNILTGFETHNSFIRNKILAKKLSLKAFLKVLDHIALAECDFTAFILYKPSPFMDDEEAYREAENTINYLADRCKKRKISLTIRMNPMYLAKGSKWAKIARSTSKYKPPRLTDIMRLVEKKASEGLRIYIGLSTEGLEEKNGTYMARNDYSSRLIKPIILFNNRKIKKFNYKKD